MIQHYDPTESDDATPEEIVEQITASRHRIDSQLHRLAQRVTPQALVHNATNSLTERSFDEAMDGISHYYAKARAFVRKRPIGTSLIAIGIVALLLESTKTGRKSSEPQSRPQPAPKRNYQI